MKLLIRAIEEVRDDVCTLPVRMRCLEVELGVSLISLCGKTDVVELNFVGTRPRHPLRQLDVVLLNFRIRAVRPNQLAVLAPRLTCRTRAHCQLGVVACNM